MVDGYEAFCPSCAANGFLNRLIQQLVPGDTPRCLRCDAQLLVKRTDPLLLQLTEQPESRTDREADAPISRDTEEPVFSRSNCLDVAGAKAKELAEACRSRSQYGDRRRGATDWIRVGPFFMAACLRGGLDDRKAIWWLCDSPDAFWFTELGLVGPWTPIGRTVLQIKNDIKDSRKPRRYEVSRPRWALKPVTWASAGPVADLVTSPGTTCAVVRSAKLWQYPLTHPYVATLESPADAAPAQPMIGYGLRNVVSTLDSDQLDRITFPDDGILVVTGCAGTGKTTVALYRAAYLVHEQRELSLQDPGATTYFEESRMLVLLRKEHLKPYLRGLAREVGVPRIQVDTFDEWFQAHIFRPYARGSGTSVAFTSSPNRQWEDWTAVIDESHIRQFLRTEWSDALGATHARCDRLVRVASEGAAVSTGTALRGRAAYAFGERRAAWSRRLGEIRPASWKLPKAAFAYLANLRSLFSQIRDDAERLGGSVATGDDPLPVSDWLRELERIRAEALRHFRVDAVLRAFYASETARNAWMKAGLQQPDAISKQLASPRRKMHRSDQPAVLWLLAALTDGMDGSIEYLAPLPVYDHVIIDEAQYYQATLLRFVRRLARPPRGAVTIVGDLAQRFATSGSLGGWDELGPGVAADRIRELDRIYRCSREVYAFLFDLNVALELGSRLVPPREVDRYSSIRPDIVEAALVEEEIRWLASQVDRLKVSGQVSSVVVVLPHSAQLERYASLVREALDDIGIPARVAHGEDMRDSTEKVMITDCDSVVGLEFDAVFLPGLSELWSDRPSGDERNALWIAASRAKRYVGMSMSQRVPTWLVGMSLGGCAVERV